MFAGVAITGSLSLSVTGSPVGGVPVTSTWLIIVPAASVSIWATKVIVVKPPFAANDPTLSQVTVHVPSPFSTAES